MYDDEKTANEMPEHECETNIYVGEGRTRKHAGEKRSKGLISQPFGP